MAGTAMLCDGTNVYRATRMLDFNMDYNKLRQWAHETFPDLFDIAWYAGVPDKTKGEFQIFRALDYMSYNGYTVITKPATTIHFTDATSGDARERLQCNVDVEITVDALAMAYGGGLSHLVLASGDGDFAPLVKHLRQMGIRTTVLSTTVTNPKICSNILRSTAHAFIEMDDIMEKIRQPAPDNAVATSPQFPVTIDH